MSTFNALVHNDTSIITFDDGSVRASTPGFGIHISIRAPHILPAAVVVTVTRIEQPIVSRVWEFDISVEHGQVYVGRANALFGEAPFLPEPRNFSAWADQIDVAFTRAFHVFAAVNDARLMRAAAEQQVWAAQQRLRS